MTVVSFSGEEDSEEIVDLGHLEQDSQDEGEEAEDAPEEEPTEAVAGAKAAAERSWSEESSAPQVAVKDAKEKISNGARLTSIRTTKELRDSRGGTNARVTRGLSKVIRGAIVEPERWIMCLLCPRGKLEC